MTLLKIAAALALLTLCPSAWGEPPSSNERPDALFQAAKELRRAGLYSQACPMFAEVRRLSPGVGISLYLGDCYQHMGRFTDAWAEFHKAELRARQTNDQRVDVARQREAAIEASVKMARRPSSDDPGQSAPASSPTESQPRHPMTASPAHASQDSGPTTSEAARGSRWTLSRPATEVGLLGIGAAGIGVGAALLAAKNHAIVEGKDWPPLAAGSGIAFGVAGASVVSSIVLYLTTPSDNQAAWHVTPAPMLAGWGAFVSKKF
jgi:hypothetical protein